MSGAASSFFARDDDRPDREFYVEPRFVTHIDAGAVAAVGELYSELGLDAGTPGCRVLDFMSSWVSHFAAPPAELVVLGLNREELDANPMATERLVHDLNSDPSLPLCDEDFDAAVCCVSIDYLTRPVEVLAEVARVLRPGAPVVLTYSNRCFPTKAVHGWLSTDDRGRGEIVARYLRDTGRFTEPVVTLRTPAGPAYRGDPLWAVIATAAHRSSPSGMSGPPG